MDNRRQDDAVKFAADMYDAVGAVWLETFGEHVHVGFYADPATKKTMNWRKAQAEHIQAILKFAGVKQADKVLDVGCGYGGTAVHVAHQLNCSVVGINTSAFQIAAGKQLAARSEDVKPNQVEFQVANALDLPFPDDTFDVVISIEASTYMPDKSKYVSEMGRVCKPGGKVILVDFHRTPGPKTKKQEKSLKHMKKMFSSPDFESPQIHEDLMAKHGLEIFAKSEITQHIRGWFFVSLMEVLEMCAEEEGFMAALKKFIKLHWLTIVGGPTVWTHVFTWASRLQNKWAKKGMKNGAWAYYLMAAHKPASAKLLPKQGDAMSAALPPSIEVVATGGAAGRGKGLAAAGAAGTDAWVPADGCFEGFADTRASGGRDQ